MLKKLFSGLALIAILAAGMLLQGSPTILYAHNGGGDDNGGDNHGGGGNGGHGGHGGQNGRAKGTIAAIDLAAGNITVSDRRNGALVTIGVTADTDIRKDNNHSATIADLGVGDRVDARYDATTFIASRIRAKGAKVEGTLTQVDVPNSTVTITPLSGTPVVLHVTAATKIERNEQHTTLDQLVVGDAAEAKYDATTMIASKVETSGL